MLSRRFSFALTAVAALTAVCLASDVAADDHFGRINVPSSTRDVETFERAVESIVLRLLRERPEILLESLQRAVRDQEEAKTRDLLVQDSALGVGEDTLRFGPVGTGVPAVFFFDYECAACKETATVLAQAAYSDEVRLYLAPLAASGEGSLLAAKAVIASGNQGQAILDAMHLALLEMETPDQESILATAQRLGVDVEQLTDDMNDPELLRQIEVSRQLARKHGVGEMPSALVGQHLLSGELTRQSLETAIEEAEAHETH